jgi:ABC-type transport system involved in multi-copper enzyme maturation permease subunit
MIFDVIRKEAKEIRKTKRLLAIGILFVVVTIAYAVVSAYWLEWGPNEMIGSGLYSIILMFVSLLSLMLAYDTIVGERNRGSLALVFSKPIGRGQFFLGKFLGTFLFIAVLFIVVSSFGYWLNAAISQEFPSGTEIAAVYKFFFAILLVIACWISFAMLFSTCFKSSAVSLITTLILWILVLPTISKMPIAYYLMEHGFNHGSSKLTEVAFPGWVKALYAVDPDLCIAELGGHILGTSPFGNPILTAGESILAMVIFIVIFFIVAFLLFRRLSLD